MLASYLKMAVRTMRNHPAFAIINVFGLGLGLFAAFMALLWVQDEMNFDDFHEDGVYQVMRTSTHGGIMSTTDAVTAQLDGVLDEEYAEIDLGAMFSWERTVTFVRGETAFRRTARTAGPDIFGILSFPFIAGNPETALVAPESIVLSESMARLYFPEYFQGNGVEAAAQNVLGETIQLENRIELTVTGIAYDAPANSSIKFDAFLAFELYARENSWVEGWGSNGFRMYLKLASGVDAALVSDKIRMVVQDHAEDPSTTELFLRPVRDGYLWSRYEDGVVVGGRIEYVRIISVVGLLILLIAAINFTNLATARSAQRALEIGIRKSFGGSRASLAGQFLGESLVTATLALLLAIAAVVAILPAFNGLTGKSLSLLGASGSVWMGFAGLTIMTGIAAGFYPALYLSGLGVLRAIRQNLSGKGGGGGLRRALVVFQFAASILLIVGTLTVYRQLQFIQSTNLGMDRENVISARLEGGARDSWDAFKAALKAHPSILEVTTTDDKPFDINTSTTSPQFEGKPEDDNTMYFMASAGYDYLKTLRMELVAGRTFDPARSIDSANVVINETAARKMGFDNPIGQNLSVWDRDGVIIGVVKDFHMRSMYSPIEPTILRLDEGGGGLFYTRTAPGMAKEALAAVEATFLQFSPGYPFQPAFLDTEYETMYRSEQVIGMLANWFAILAVTIACLGLYGLASFTTARRTKEIGVRKVLGASVTGVVLMLSREFTLLVGAGFALAAPIAWILMSDWLGKFEFRIDLGFGIFVAAALGMFLLTYATVGFHSVRAARANPARSLRSD